MARKRRAGTPAVTRLTEAGVGFEIRTYRHDPRVADYGREAAEALGVPPERVFKTLVARCDQDLVVGIVPVSGQLDLKALARAVGTSRATMASPEEAQRATGYVLGGISPIGQRRSLTTVLDRSALDHATILVSGGKRGLDLELAPEDLREVTRAVVAPIARGSS